MLLLHQHQHQHHINNIHDQEEDGIFDLESHHQSDGFNGLSDDLILLIFNQLSDTKSLTRCRSVSKRFNSLVPQSENLLVKVDCVLSTETPNSILHVLRSLLHSLISPKRIPFPSPTPPNSPSRILRGFEKIKRLEIELPSGDLQLEKGTVLRWKADFGKSLKSCVILAVRQIQYLNPIEQKQGNHHCVCDDDDDEEEVDFISGGENGCGLKLRVVWTISALIAASARHYLLREVIREHTEIQRLVLRDRQGEGRVEMDEQGLTEFRHGQEEDEPGEVGFGWKNRTTVPAVRMRMRHVASMDLPGGVRITGATLVIVRPAAAAAAAAAGNGGVEKKKINEVREELMEDEDVVAKGVFDGVLGQAVGALLKKPSYLLEMNSF